MSIIRRIIDHFHPSDRREHIRNLHPHLALDIGGTRYTTINWSLGGCKILSYHEEVSKGFRLSGTIKFETGQQGQFVAEVVDLKSDGSLGLKFSEISPEIFVTMAGLKGV